MPSSTRPPKCRTENPARRTASALADYARIMASAVADYDRIMTSARADYQRTTASVFARAYINDKEE